MAENKRSFILYCDLIHVVDKLPNEKAGELFKHILSYVNDKNPETDDLILQLAFEPVKQQLKRDLLKWSDTRSSRSESGRLGGIKSGEVRKNKSKQNEANEANASKQKQNEANEAVNVNVTVNVNDNDNDNDNTKKISSDIFDLVKSFYDYKLNHSSDIMKGVKLNESKSAKIIDELIRIDGFTLDDVKNVLRWSLKDDFWSKQILSFTGLRKKGKNGETKFVNCRSSYLKSIEQPKRTSSIIADPLHQKKDFYAQKFE